MPWAWHLRGRPVAELSNDIFELRRIDSVPLSEGKVRVCNRWLSVDPYMYGLLSGKGRFLPALPLGNVMPGGAVGEVIESRSPRLAVGTIVLHEAGWSDQAVVDAASCVALADDSVPIQRYLGHLGMPGRTAYVGLLSAAEARTGDIILVSAAAGAVGSAVVQIARLKGMTVIAAAGGAAKCALAAALGADAVIDYKAPGAMREKLASAAPTGIDVYFDNVGGDHLDAALECARQGARFALCGMVGDYDDPCLRLKDPMRIVIKGIRLQGFNVAHYDHSQADFDHDMKEWMRDGKIISPETVMEGLEAVPAAFFAMMRGSNLGKMLVKL